MSPNFKAPNEKVIKQQGHMKVPKATHLTLRHPMKTNRQRQQRQFVIKKLPKQKVRGASLLI